MKLITSALIVIVALAGCSKKEEPPVPQPVAPVPAAPKPASVPPAAVVPAPTPVTPAVTAPAAPATLTLAALSQGEVADGMKQALAKGIEQAIANLGKDGGFLNNLQVKIPMPESLRTVDKTLRTLGQGKLADEFVATINHAAEQAVPAAASVFADSIRVMTVEDAKAILTGSNDAATLYFRKTSEAKLTEKFLPIVKQATEKVGVTASYKNLLKQAGPTAQFISKDAGDLDAYVTRKSLDGLFVMVAAEEQRIRQSPAARTTDVLRKIFGSIQK